MSPTARHRLCFCLVLLNVFVSLSIACALEPLLPPLAQKKNMSNSVSGLFFGTIVLLTAIASIVARPFLKDIGLKLSLSFGAVVTGVCAVLTSILQFSPPGETFIALCFSVNVVQSLGSGLIMMAAYSALPVLYPQSMGFANGCMILSTTAAFALSPAIAGALNDVGGFFLPISIMGGIEVLVGLLSACFVNVETQEDESSLDTVKAGMKVVFNAPVSIAMLTILFTSIATGFTSPTLEPFLNSSFQLSSTYIGLLFLVSAAGGFISPFIGLVCDRYMKLSKLLQAPAQLICGASILLWNPSPMLDLGDPKLWLTIVSLAVYGLAMTQLLASASSDLFQESERVCGNGEIYATITAVFYNLVYSIGLFVGSLLGGVALDTVGFANATTLLGCGVAAMGVPNIAYQLWRICRLSRVQPEDTGDLHSFSKRI